MGTAGTQGIATEQASSGDANQGHPHSHTHDVCEASPGGNPKGSRQPEHGWTAQEKRTPKNKYSIDVEHRSR